MDCRELLNICLSIRGAVPKSATGLVEKWGLKCELSPARAIYSRPLLTRGVTEHPERQCHRSLGCKETGRPIIWLATYEQ